jgi:branched-chain amino acid transport system substrate-binding protein
MSRLRAGVVLALLMVGVAGCGSSSSGGSSSSSGGGGGSATAPAAAASSSASGTTAKSGTPIKIGAVIDETGIMKPTDEPALWGAQLEVKKINAQGGVDGHKLQMTVLNDQLNPGQTSSDAIKSVSSGANVLWVTCDVDFSTPSIQVGLSHKLLTVSPCIGTDQMGPKRFGSAGSLAFSFGNVAEDEGAADAQIAIKNGWKTADVATDKQIVYNQDVCKSFATKFQALGGKIVDSETWTQGDHTVGDVANHLNSAKSDAIMVCTTGAPDIATLLSGVRSSGNQTPFLAPWSLDGTYWMPKSPKIANNVWTDSYVSIYGDDPSPAVRAMIGQLKAEGHTVVTGGFVTGAAAVDGIVAALKQTGGSTDGAKMAAAIQAFHNLPTISGAVSFSSSLHTVSGRSYRVLEVTNGVGHFKYLINAEGKG